MSLKISGKKFEDGSKLKIVSVENRPGGYTIVTGLDSKGDCFRKRVVSVKTGSTLGAFVSGRQWLATIDQKRFGAGNAAVDIEAALKAQFPGKVRKVFVTSGTEVEEGTPLLLIEAMKIEFSIKAPVKGKVEKVLVAVDQTLNPGDKLVDFKEAETEKAK